MEHLLLLHKQPEPCFGVVNQEKQRENENAHPKIRALILICLGIVPQIGWIVFEQMCHPNRVGSNLSAAVHDNSLVLHAYSSYQSPRSSRINVPLGFWRV